VLDEGALRAAAATAEDRGKLAGEKHAEDDLADEATWAAVLCDGRDTFVEAIFIPERGHDSVESIVVEQRVFDLADADPPPSADELLEAELLVSALKALPDALLDLISEPT
jgi:hypothetical protein